MAGMDTSVAPAPRRSRSTALADLLGRVGAYRRWRRHVGHRLLRALSRESPDIFFVEVGAGDGITEDHLRPFAVRGEWRGIMVEPVPYVFDQLRRNYEGVDGVSLERAAIADHDGEAVIHHFREPAPGEAVPAEYHLLGSLSRERLARHANVPDAEERIVELRVPCLQLATLLQKHGAANVDVLVVDAEGADCAIVGQLDLRRLRPRVIAYEDVHVAGGARAACALRLRESGYALIEEGFDTWAVDVGPDDAVTRTWKRLLSRGPALPRASLDRWFDQAG